MESFSKLSHDPLQTPHIEPKNKFSPVSPPPHFLPSLLFTLIQHLEFIVLLLSTSLESYLILQKPNDHVSHILPLLAIFLLLARHGIKHSCFWNPQPVYLVDFSCYSPPAYCRVPFAAFLEHASLLGIFSKESVGFMARVLANSGQGQETYLPPALLYLPPRSSYKYSIDEVHTVLFPVMEDLLRNTRLSPRQVDILIVNCSGLCPSPSLTSIVINRFKMREDVKSYNLSGMGCSGSMAAVDMARNLLAVNNQYRNRNNPRNAVILSTEILSTGWYPGNDPSKLVLNCVFRMGAAAILLTNSDKAKTAKYRLVRSFRTQRAFSDPGYRSAWRDEDSNGFTGVTLHRDILVEAGATLRTCITSLGPSILPLSEKLRFALSFLRLKLRLSKSDEAVYTPNFKTVIDHFCLPVSGTAVIKEIGKGLKLDQKDMEAAMATLHRFGNQSSSSLWYELAYIEAKERVKKGGKVWQIAMGSGPKCTSVVWECIRPIVGEAQSGPWADCIDRYPDAMVQGDK